MSDEFIAYVGPPDLHDGQIVQVISEPDTITVLVKSYEGRQFDIVFVGVTDHHATAPEGMTLSALVEMQCPAPQRKFVFANWDEDDTAELTIVAAGFKVVDDA